MKKLFLLLAVLMFLGIAHPADAHRSGCHRWHSCPSDTGSYICGDLGYTSGCPIVRTPTPRPLPTETLVAKTTPNPLPYFVGIPRTYRDLYSCKVVGNYSSMIYHLKGSSYIRRMNLSKKECFASSADAISKGFRASKVY